jgi:integrase
MGEHKIGLNTVRALKPREIKFDRGTGSVTGFFARRQQSDAVSFGVFYRSRGGRQRWFTIGRHGAPWTPDTARDEARVILGKVAKGEDPAGEKKAERNAETVSDLCNLYLADAEQGLVLTRRRKPKKASTLATDRGRIEWHIKPLLGRFRVAAVTTSDVETFMHSIAKGKTAAVIKSKKKRGVARVRGGRGAATRTTGLLGGIFEFAVRNQMRPDNPVRGIIREADGRRERRLTDDEYAALGAALRKADAANIWLPAIAATRFIALTGWRRGEVLGLRWSEVDLTRRTAVLADTKTGKSARPLSNAACDVLRGLNRTGDGLVFPATRGDGSMAGYPKLWKRIAKLGKLPQDIGPHVMRHSLASLAADLGMSEPTIGALLGHQQHSITSRYVHSADAVLLLAADAVADETAMRMGEKKIGKVIKMPKRA